MPNLKVDCLASRNGGRLNNYSSFFIVLVQIDGFNKLKIAKKQIAVGLCRFALLQKVKTLFSSQWQNYYTNLSLESSHYIQRVSGLKANKIVNFQIQIEFFIK